MIVVVCAAGVYCNGCSCTDCQNLQVNDELITRERNRIVQREGPQAFGRKVRLHDLSISSMLSQQPAVGSQATGLAAAPMPCSSGALHHQCKHTLSFGMLFVVQNAIQAAGVHLKGCRCSRSKCAKKYCECYDYQVPCSELCK